MDGKLGFVTQLDNIIYDYRLRFTMPRGPLGSGPALDERIVILDIDETSLGEIGRWPWSRNVMADLVTKLFDKYGIRVLGFDVVWAERDTSSGIDSARRAGQEGPEADRRPSSRRTRSCARGSTTTACSRRRSRAGRWCSATTSTPRTTR